MDSALHSHIQSFFAQPQPEARRLFHGRGHCFRGLDHLCIDWFGPAVLISAYQPLADKAELATTLKQADKHDQIRSIILQHRYEAQSPAECLFGDLVEELEVREADLMFEVHPGRRQNAGLFLDMRPLRTWLQENSAGKNVLNLFAYTCSLSVAALAGGAERVTNVDLSKTSIAWGERNHLLNGQSLERVKSIPYNLFTSWGRIKQFGRYDLIIIDPPTRQRGSFDSARDYGAVIRKLKTLGSEDCEYIAALNSPFLGSDFLLQQFAKYFPECKPVGTIAVAPEFEESEAEKGLKIIRFKVPRGNP